jgi:hypothetical protein
MLKNERAPPAATERGSKSKHSGHEFTPEALQDSTNSSQFEITGEVYDLVPPGRYQLRFVRSWTSIMFGRQPKLALNFQIVDFGEYNGKRVTRWYNVKQLIGKHGPSGHFRIGKRSDFLAEYAQLFGMPSRNDRFALSHLKAVIVAATIGTVTRSYNQKGIHTSLQYSVVRELLSIEMGTWQKQADP